MNTTINGLLLPFLGTALGAACVFFIKDKISVSVTRAFEGFAAGVMVAASFWSLLVPAAEQSAHLGRLSFVPCLIGFWAGILLLLLLNRITARVSDTAMEKSGLKRSTMLFLAVTLHNIPEGMAVGVALAGALGSDAVVTVSGALTLALGIALQNLPEGAIISLPLKGDGMKKLPAFMYGALSGAAEPIAAIITLYAASSVTAVIPYFLSFAAGSMVFVAIDELLNENSRIGTVFFAVGFSVLMVMNSVLA